MTSSTNQSQATISNKAFNTKKGQVNVDMDSVSMREESFSFEQELKKFVDWGDAMVTVETWNKRIVKIREKVEKIERNTKI